MPSETTASMYQSKSSTQHGKDYGMFPNTSQKFELQYNKATTPARSIIQERPSHILINKAGTYNFLYNTTCSIGGTTGETFTQGAVVTNPGTTKLEIQPVAWSGGDAETNITFVYTGVK